MPPRRLATKGMSNMRITIRGVRPEVLESTREAGRAVATRVRYDVLLSDEPRSQWRACFTSPSSYCVDDLPSQYTFGEQSISFECPRNEAKEHFDQLKDYIRLANAKSQKLEDLSRESVPQAKAKRQTTRAGRKEPRRAGGKQSQIAEQELEAFGREIDEETSGWLTGTEEEK